MNFLVQDYVSYLYQNGERLSQYNAKLKVQCSSLSMSLHSTTPVDFKHSALQNNPAFPFWPDIHYSFTPKSTILQQCYNLEEKCKEQ